jgi:hypothetical protein
VSAQAAVVAPVELRVQLVAGLKPPGELLEKLTEPLGALAVPEPVSVTVAVQELG